MRFIVAQTGARRGYAVPALLEAAGLLERFYTDVTADVGAGRWLVKCGRLMGFGREARRLAGRRVPESIRSKTSTFGWPALGWTWNRRSWAKQPADLFRQQLRWNRAWGRAMVRRGFGRATHLYSMLGECGPLLTEARRRGIKTITEIYILLSTERILKQEQRAFPEWEPAPPDFESIRREFAPQENWLAGTDFAVCPAPLVKQDLMENFGFEPERGAVVPYAVPRNHYLVQAQPLAGRVLFVGTAGLRKGIHYLAMAAEQLRAGGRSYEFRVAGNAPRQILEHPACRGLNFLGRVPRDEVYKEYAKADLLVLPSLAEGSAESVYEALASGVPVITTAAAGSVVRDGIEGRLVPERDVCALARSIEELVEQRGLRQRMAQAARRRAVDYSPERYGERLVAALRGFET